MKISLSVIGKLGNYFDELKNLNIAVNDIAIPSIGNPKTPKNKIHIHFNSGGQSQDSALQYIRLLKKLI